MKVNQNAKNATVIGALCTVSYLAVYIARNILGAVTPMMIETGSFTEEYIGAASSLFFVFYAVGQLINGMIGNKIKAKYMMTLGLLLAGISSTAFAAFPLTPEIAYVAYALTGFFLAMIYGPMTKLVSENTEPIYATRCSTVYTFASYFGSPAAGMLAAIFTWQSALFAGGALLGTMAVISFISFAVLEKRRIITYSKSNSEEKKKGSLKLLFRQNYIKFCAVSMITGVIRTSVVFWLTTYFADHLGYSEKTAATVFSVATLVISFAAPLAVYVYEKLKYDMDKTLLIMFITSAVFFASAYFIKLPLLNVIAIVGAVMASNGAATMLWSIYCMRLKNTGVVSGATGFLDFLSYLAAATANSVFASLITSVGWQGMIAVWTATVILGVIVSIPFKKRKSAEKS
ncbi:MAG: MFS transporter [Clostridia bacterium]|nr:MFS transporter [Clostridia bacterium]